jgi:hypothetical protein
MQSVFPCYIYDGQTIGLSTSRTRGEVMMGSVCLVACPTRKYILTAHEDIVPKCLIRRKRECKTVVLSFAALYTGCISETLHSRELWCQCYAPLQPSRAEASCLTYVWPLKAANRTLVGSKLGGSSKQAQQMNQKRYPDIWQTG